MMEENYNKKNQLDINMCLRMLLALMCENRDSCEANWGYELMLYRLNEPLEDNKQWKLWFVFGSANFIENLKFCFEN